MTYYSTIFIDFLGIPSVFIPLQIFLWIKYLLLAAQILEAAALQLFGVSLSISNFFSNLLVMVTPKWVVTDSCD